MPELPEVETVMRGLEPVLVGSRFAAVEQRRADLRFPLPKRFAARLRGRGIEALERRAKYILAFLDSGSVLAMHLGMSGRFTIEWPDHGSQHPGVFAQESGTNPAHDHVIFEMSNGATIRYNDVRRFGYMDLIPKRTLAEHKHFRSLGVEPLGGDLTPDFLAAAYAGKRTSLKSALMDQKIIAGLGNIYVCEALHRARLSPERGASTLATASERPSRAVCRLVTQIKSVLRDAIDAGGSTLRDYQRADGSLGYFQHSFAVYDRAGLDCLRPKCGGTIERIVQTGRSTFFCPLCQR